MRAFVPLVLTVAAFAAVSGKASETIPLAVSGFKHISFDDIPKTVYSDSGDSLCADVKKSSSFLLQPFAKARSVKRVAFEWRGDGVLRTPSAAAEREKGGDDARLRVGLVLAGEAPLVPIFAPAWIKAIRDIMKLPSDRMLYLVVDAKSPPGSRWASPYSDSMELRALPSTPLADGWRGASTELAPAHNVVGLWIMADGDNTESTFKVCMRHLALHG